MFKKISPFILLIILCVIGIYAGFQIIESEQTPNETVSTDIPVVVDTTKILSKKVAPVPEFYKPTTEFTEGITKKKFGTYVTFENSPTPPERFIGYHTGVDVEFENVEKEVPVKAISSGTVVYSGYINGYGGVVLITHKIKGAERTVVYGHLDPASLPLLNKRVKANEPIGMLGDNRSSETNGERKHLHFAILSDSRIDFRGYVQEKSQLSGWLNPLSLNYN